jgi:colanic acid/amylovoran biosynthesis glycosyltransferase
MIPEQPRVEERDGARWIRVPFRPGPGLSFASHIVSFLRDWRRESRGRTDVILAYQLAINGVLGALAARGGPPLVSWVRSEEEIRLRESRKYRILSPPVLARSTRVLVQAEVIREEMLAELQRARGESAARALAPRVRVLPNAIEIGPEPGLENREGIVFLGRLVPVKGIEILLEALRRIPDPPTLYILGDGPLRADLETRAHGLPVVFEGRIALQDVPARLERARLLAAPSRSEGFPNAVLEAYERGVPAVAADVGGIHEVVRQGETGFLIPPGDPDALARRITTILTDDGLWRRMSRAAREAAKAYAWEPHLERLETILTEAVAAKRTFVG